MQRWIGWLAILAGAFASPAGAEAGAPDCAGSQRQMQQCTDRNFALEDAELNRRYRAAMEEALDELARDLLRAAQRAWLAFRDAACAQEGDAVRGGTMRPLLEAACATQMTRQRLLELGHSLEAPDRGLSAGILLARLRDRAPEAVQNGVYWLPESVREADFNGDGAYDLAAVGLTPADIRGKGSRVHVLLLPAGAERPHHASVGIGEAGFCAPPQAVRVEYPTDGGLPMLAVDDGGCDAFRFGLTAGARPSLRVIRN